MQTWTLSARRMSARPSHAARLILAALGLRVLFIPCMLQALGLPPPEPLPLPVEMHFCAANCSTLVLEGDRYVGKVIRQDVWTVERFDRDAVVLRRHGLPPKGRDSLYAGRVWHERLADWTQDGQPANFRLAWGSAIRTVPGSNQERDYPAPDASPMFSPPEVFHICEGACYPARGGGCLSFVNDYCGLLTRDGPVYDAVWAGGLRSRIAVVRWQAGAIMLKTVDDPVHEGQTHEFSGSLAKDGAVYGVQRVHWPGHWPASPAGPGIHEFVIKAWAERDAPPPVPACPDALLPAGAPEASVDNVALARRAGDLATAVCWDRIRAAQPQAAGDVQYAYDLLFGTAGLERDYAEVMRLADRAAGHSSILALMIGARLYREGLGVQASQANANTLELAYRQRYAAQQLAATRDLTLHDKVRRCEDDWELMGQIGFDCYAVLETYAHADLEAPTVDESESRCTSMPPRATSEGDFIAPSERKARCLDQDREDRRAARNNRDARWQEITQICGMYRGANFLGGQAFDLERCLAPVRGP